MKKLVIMLGVWMLFVSFTYSAKSFDNIELLENSCIKEQDPLKRLQFCHMLDVRNQTKLMEINMHCDSDFV